MIIIFITDFSFFFFKIRNLLKKKKNQNDVILTQLTAASNWVLIESYIDKNWKLRVLKWQNWKLEYWNEKHWKLESQFYIFAVNFTFLAARLKLM